MIRNVNAVISRHYVLEVTGSGPVLISYDNAEQLCLGLHSHWEAPGEGDKGVELRCFNEGMMFVYKQNSDQGSL